jgi:hypothetical protein
MVCRAREVPPPYFLIGKRAAAGASTAPSGESAGAPAATPATGLPDASPALTLVGGNSVVRQLNSAWTSRPAAYFIEINQSLTMACKLWYARSACRRTRRVAASEE